MEQRKIGHLEVSAIGMGCMGFSHGYGPGVEKDESIALIRKAHEMGCTFFDTAFSYGQGENEKLIGEVLHSVRDKVKIATKFRVYTENGNVEKQVENAVDGALKRLNTERIDLFYLHRINPEIAVEEVAISIGKMIESGKINGWGLSQASADEIRRANNITQLTAIQSEYSIMERYVEENVLPTCKELGIGLVPFSPLASGFLSGKYSTSEQYTGDDVRRVITRFNKQNIIANQVLIDLLNTFALQKEATPAQISLAWLLYKDEIIVPIPGMRTFERIQENLGAADISLSVDEFNEIEHALSNIKIYGNRTDQDIAKLKELDD